MIVTLILAAGEAWETDVLAGLEGRRDIAVLRRCMDTEDLLAAAASGQADAAVVSVDAAGFDRHAVEVLRRTGIRLVAILPSGPGADGGRVRAHRAGVDRMLGEDELAALPSLLAEPEGTQPAVRPAVAGLEQTGPQTALQAGAGSVLTVIGPHGGPGRTTLAAGLAAELGRRGSVTLLIDADPYGGAVAQQLGILDEISGLLAASRLFISGDLAARLSGSIRMLGPNWGVLTGLPRPERWSEIPPGTLSEIAEVAVGTGQVVIDAGWSLEEPVEIAGGGRNQLTIDAVEAADRLLVVGSADPVGLTRLARMLADLAERADHLHVAVNRMRTSLGWSERDIAGMVATILTPASLTFLPEDRATVDKALVAGRTLLEASSEGALTKAIGELADNVCVPQAANSR